MSSSLFDRRRRSSSATAPAEGSEERDPEPAPRTSGTPAPADAAVPSSPGAAPSTPAAAPSAPSPLSAPSASSAPTDSTPEPTASIPTPDPPEDEDAATSGPEVELLSPDTQIAPIDDEDAPQDDPAPVPRRAPARRPAAPTDVGGDLENTGAYDDLFGKTVFRRIEDAAVRRAEEDEEPEAGTSGTPAPDSAPAAPAADHVESTGDVPESPAPAPEQPAAPSEFIDWVPGVGRAAPEVAQTAARRASAPPPADQDYPQVQRAERPPAPRTGSRPAPTRAPQQSHPSTSPPPSAQPPAPYENVGPASPYGGPMNTSAAGQRLGFPPGPGQPPHRARPPVDPGAAGHRLGFPSTPAPRSEQGQAPSWGSPPPPAAPAHPAAPGQGRPPQRGVPAQPAAPSAPSAGSVSRAAGGTVTLSGLLCPHGHPNSPERGACRFCGAPLQGPTRAVVRPPLGSISISSGGGFVLDRTAIIGRRPRASRVSGDDVPQLVTVPSPQQDISRSHLELRLEGWHVVAVDLGTTNGTTLHREGFEPVRLRSREGVVLHDGDLLDLGDGVHLGFGERV